MKFGHQTTNERSTFLGQSRRDYCEYDQQPTRQVDYNSATAGDKCKVGRFEHSTDEIRGDHHDQ
jgi:hypothetical protein